MMTRDERAAIKAINQKLASIAKQIAGLYAVIGVDLPTGPPSRSKKKKVRQGLAARALLAKAPDDLMLSRQEAATMLGIGASKLRELRLRGEVQGQSFGYRSLRFSAKSIRDYLRKQRGAQREP
jgi:Helix-turn-helix domain